MIHIDFDETAGLAVVRPERMRGLSESDFARLRDLVDRYLEDHESLRGLVIVADSFPGWEDYRAFIAHFAFVRDHHRRIAKVALVSDDPVLSGAPGLVDHFVNARVKHFAASELARAKAWAASDEPPKGRFVTLEGLPEDVVAVRAEGVITREDYEKTLIPAIEKVVAARRRVKLLYWCGPDFEGFSAGAMWDDAWFGLTHLGSFSKIAVVSDIAWLRQSVKFFAPLLPAPVQVFDNADIEAAKGWIAED
jgi:hypothetical protein